MKIIDRYVIRQVVMPFGIGLLVFTFLIMLRPLQEYAEALVAKNLVLRRLVRGGRTRLDLLETVG